MPTTPRAEPARRRKHKTKPSERAILGVVRAMVDPETGELVGCFCPAYPIDRHVMRERGLRTGTFVTMDVFEERHGKFWRLWHQLAGFVADNVEAMNGLKAHDALKRIQLDAKLHCELADFHLEDGTVLRHFVPKSLNFEDTDEGAAQEIWDGLCDYIARTYFAGWDQDQVAEAAAHWARDK